MNDRLIDWLNGEMNSRNLSARELSKQLGKANSYVSQVLTGKMKPGVDFYTGIAEALDVPIEKILRLAGILPPGAGGDDNAEPSFRDWIEAGKNLSREERLEILNYADYVTKKRKSS